MANIKKNFNFRNGVQVDDDNLLVTSTGLVGIGTTVPAEALDVRGNAVISGFTSITTANIGIVTISTLDPTQIIGAGVSIKSGIVTAQGTGIVTFFGDARFLQGMPTSQWEDVDVGLGYTSIFNTGGNVGIATTDPRSSLQVGNNVDASQKGVGISSVGNINASGIITASSFVGNLTGNIASNTIISGNVDLNGDIDVDGHTNIDNVSVAGVSTFSGSVRVNDKVDITGILSTSADVNFDLQNTFVYTDVSTDSFEFGNKAGYNGRSIVVGWGTEGESSDFEQWFFGHSYIRNTNKFNPSSELRLLSGGLETGGAVRIGIGTTQGTANTSLIRTSALFNNGTELYHNNQKKLETVNSGINVVGTTTSGQLSVTGISTFGGNLDINADIDVDGHTNLDNINVAGVSTFAGDVNTTFVGASSTAFALKIGVGTTEAPANDIQVRKSGNAEIQITSETGIAGLSFGRETALQKINAGEIRFGGGPGFNFSSAKSLDIINYSTGNFNYHLSANNPAAVEGDFIWHRGANSAKLMTLTGIGGSLGIGITNPSDELHVIGGATFTGTVTVQNSVNVTNLVSASAVISSLTGSVTGNLSGNVNSPTGISTFNNISVGGIGTFADTLQTDLIAIGGGTATSVRASNDVVEINPVLVGGNPSRVFVRSTGEVGFKQTAPAEINDAGPSPAIADISAGNCIAIFKVLSVGQDKMGSSVDFSNAGVSTARFMLPPKVTTSGRGNLQNVVAGALIYNTSTNKLQVFNGSAWQDCN